MVIRVLTYIALAVIAVCTLTIIGEAALIVINLLLMAVGIA